MYGSRSKLSRTQQEVHQKPQKIHSHAQRLMLGMVQLSTWGSVGKKKNVLDPRHAVEPSSPVSSHCSADEAGDRIARTKSRATAKREPKVRCSAIAAPNGAVQKSHLTCMQASDETGPEARQWNQKTVQCAIITLQLDIKMYLRRCGGGRLRQVGRAV